MGRNSELSWNFVGDVGDEHALCIGFLGCERMRAGGWGGIMCCLRALTSKNRKDY